MDKGSVVDKLTTLEDMDKVRSNGTPFHAADPSDKVLLGKDNIEDDD